MRKTLLLTAFVAGYFLSPAQDTLRVMTYNVLNYSSGNYPTRYNDLKEIVAHVQPDIVICQEIVNAAGAQLLLDNAFNPGGGSTYSRATFIDGPDSDNSLYYNAAKIKFKSQAQIATDLRNITHYRVYYLLSSTDTVWINLFSAHLKASTGGGEEALRLQECKDLCNYMAGLSNTENILVGGDFNFYGQSTETGFNWLTGTNCSHRLYDPVNRVGNWNNNATFVDVHTQSTRTANEPDGGSTGGLDDRFDWLFANNNIINGLSKARYIPGSYTALGQDQNHFNKAINASPVNTAVPAIVADALYNMSDHLPVYLDLAVGNTVGMSEYSTNLSGTHVKWVGNGVTGRSDFLITAEKNERCLYRVFDLTGKQICAGEIQLAEGPNTFSIGQELGAQGQYLLRIEKTEGWTGCRFVRY